MTTRGEFGATLFEQLGLSPSKSSPVFSDGGGRMDGVLTALKDAGITNGVGDGKFGTSNTITRGEAFTMLARAYGLAGSGDSIEQAAQSLVNAGVVNGYADGSLGLGDALDDNQMSLLMGRMSGVGTPVTDSTVATGEGARLDTELTADPEFVAQLRGFGLSEEQIRATNDFQATALNNRLASLGDVYGEQRKQAAQGINISSENRGMFRSGGRLKQLAESEGATNHAQTAAEDSLNTQIDSLGLDMANQLANVQRQRSEAEAAARGRLSAREYDTAVQTYEAGTL